MSIDLLYTSPYDVICPETPVVVLSFFICIIFRDEILVSFIPLELLNSVQIRVLHDFKFGQFLALRELFFPHLHGRETPVVPVFELDLGQRVEVTFSCLVDKDLVWLLGCRVLEHPSEIISFLLAY
jgi:hypothetical protein